MRIGGCECKSIRYQFSGSPLTCYACHCTDCQTSSGSAFGLSMLAKDSDVEITKGKISISTVIYNDIEVQRHHCGQCGTGLWFSANKYPGLVALKPGTFDDTTWFKPIAHLWVRSSPKWVVLDESTPRYEKQPEMSELIDLWAKRENA